ncbi:MAG: PIN domain-containing protein [Bacteroidia bacterium]
MIDFVIDANVLISILLSGKAGYRPILSFNNFILPDFALIEIEKYRDILRSKTKMSHLGSWKSSAGCSKPGIFLTHAR